MKFIRRQFEVTLRAATSQQSVPLESVTVNYQLNGIPSARVELGFGQSFTQTVAQELSQATAVLEQWIDTRELIQIVVKTTSSQTTGVGNAGFSPTYSGSTQVIFEGYIDVPSTQITNTAVGYSFNLQHWSRDLTIGSLAAWYALPNQPGQPNLPAIYTTRNASGTNQARVEGIPYKLGLGAGWETQIGDDLWELGQKPVLQSLIDMKYLSGFIENFTDCRDALNKPSSKAGEAIQRITTTNSPLKISSRISASHRTTLIRKLAWGIGMQPLAGYQRVTAWDKILSFCNDLGCVFVPRATDALIIPANFAAKSRGTVIPADELAELAWSSYQQLLIRGAGFIIETPHAMGNASIAQNRAQANPQSGVAPTVVGNYGCYIGSPDPNEGIVHFGTAPYWLENIPNPIALQRQVQLRRGQSGSQPVTNTTAPAPQTPTPAEEHDLHTLYAKFRYLEKNLLNRVIRFSTPFRTDLAPGSLVTLQVPLTRSGIINSPVNLTGTIVALTLSISRNRRQAVTIYQADYTRTSQQLNLNGTADLYAMESHPLFDTYTPAVSIT